MFVVSKLFWWLFDPSNLILVALVVGAALLWTPWSGAGRTLVATAVGVAALVTILPVGDWLGAPLERRFPVRTPDDVPKDIAGILVLGGGINASLTAAYGQPALNSHAERLTRAVALARRFPNLPVVFTGGSAALIDTGAREASGARQFFEDIGLEPDRVSYESRARNTRENATNTYSLVGPKPDETWLLMTSAMHMPRAVGAFRRAGWRILAYPVDFTIGNSISPAPRFRFVSGLASLSNAAHEWFGLAAYRILGWSSRFFPAPGEGDSRAMAGTSNR